MRLTRSSVASLAMTCFSCLPLQGRWHAQACRMSVYCGRIYRFGKNSFYISTKNGYNITEIRFSGGLDL